MNYLKWKKNMSPRQETSTFCPSRVELNIPKEIYKKKKDSLQVIDTWDPDDRTMTLSRSSIIVPQ